MSSLTIIGNWKMNTTPSTARILAAEIRDRLRTDGETDTLVVLCPPAIALESVSGALNGSGIAVGVQNIYPSTSGAFTGEVSPQMARELAEFVIVGHSERRELFGESDEFVGRKVAAASEAGMRPILCVGESLDIRRSGHAERFVSDQLLEGVSRLENASGLIVAYEPVWAIGTGESATPEVTQMMLATLRHALVSRFGEQAASVPHLYGGSVNADNIRDLVRQPDIDGALIGGASLSAESFAAIVKNAAEICA